MRVFVDTNLWVYRLDHREPEKSAFVRDWLRNIADEHDIVVSTQVLIELRSVVTRQFHPPLAKEDTRAALSAVAAFDVVPGTEGQVLDAHELAERYQLAWSDALIAEAAIRSGCSRLYSEAFQHEQRVGELTIINPFKQAMESR